MDKMNTPYLLVLNPFSQGGKVLDFGGHPHFGGKMSWQVLVIYD